MAEKQKPWQVVARDSGDDPIYGPWETRAEAEKRERDWASSRFIVSTKIVPQK